MKKHAKSLLIAATLVLAATPATVYAQVDETVQQNVDGIAIQNHAPGEFVDLEGHFAKNAANHLGNMGLMMKKMKTNFNPDAPIDRKEFVDLVEKGLGKKNDSMNNADAHLTRLDVAELIAKSMPAVNTGINGGNMSLAYDDTPGITADQKTALQYLYMTGIMVGDGQGHFNPKASLTRGEAAVLLESAIERSLQGGKDVAYEKQSGEFSEAVYTLVNENKMQEGLFSVVDGDTRYLLLSGGEVPTGGFSVIVGNIKETDAGIFVQATLKVPVEGQMMTEAVDHPYAVIAIKDTTKPVYLIGQE
ncbi:MAG: S-layer homology domain-containing protein [Tumebacillaceae bacterium]